MKRKIYDELIKWKERNGEVALLIDGARRIGKSYIVDSQGQNYCGINYNYYFWFRIIVPYCFVF